MKLVTKVLVSAIILMILAPITGYVLIETTYQNELTRQSKILDDGATQIAKSSSPLSSALVFADESSAALTIAFIDMSGSMTSIVDGEIAIDENLSMNTLLAATKKSLYFDDHPSRQIRTVQLADKEFVVLAVSSEVASHGRDNNLLALAIFSFVLLIVGGASVTILIRRDLSGVIKTLAGTANQERETRQSMQSFMGDASHELRTPLTVIKGYAELLAQSGSKTTAEQREKAYGRIIEQVNRMDDTISSLLELAEVGSVSSNSFDSVDLASLVGSAAEDLQALSPKRPISTSLESLSAIGSADLLARLLANAIGNINRHTVKTDPVRFSLRKERKFALLIIEDGGPGLPAESYAKGIQGFRRFDESRSRETGGTGLGMTIMNSIVEAHAGEMTIGPSELGGLKLEIRLPLN